MATKHVSTARPTPATVAASARQPYDEPLPGVGEAPAPATEKSPAPASTAPKSERAKKSSAVKIEQVQFGEIQPAAPDTFERKTNAIPEDHPLVQAFRASYDNKRGVDVPTTTPDALVKILRRIANQEGKGVAIKQRPGVVAFQAQDRKKVVRKKPANAAS